MTGALKVVTYELYTLEHSGWVLHSRFPSAEKDDALLEAKSIELNLERATKLVRETYFPDENHYQEAVVRISPNLAEYKKKLRRPTPEYRIGGSSSLSKNDPFAEFAFKSNPKPLETRKVITGITMMIATSMIIAGGVTAILSLLLKSHFLRRHISQHDDPPILFATFIAVFLLAALPLISRYIPHLLSPPKGDKDTDTPQSEQSFLNFAAEDNPAEQSENQSEEPALFKNDPGLITQEVEPPPPPPLPTPPTEEPAKKKTEKKAKKEKPKETPAPEPTVKKEDQEESLQEPEDESSVPDKTRMAMMRFLTGTITILKDVCPQLDAYNKFGLNLVLAGACFALSKRSKLNAEQLHDLTVEALTMIGGKAALANQFYKTLEDHLTDPRYADMYQQGQSAIDAYIDRTGQPFEDLKQAMTLWNKPSDRITGAKIVTVMFTDIVSSTLITYKRGDEKAQVYIRKHNTIVRKALLDHQGEEIKHTGDGIMASFAAPANAIDAATEIQKAIEAHNQENPNDAFELRIGINTGEPIREEDDLFGSTVQLAARVCSAAEPSHIYISNVVKELLEDKYYPMEPLPPRTLKGVKEAQIFHNVLWQEIPTPPASTQEAPKQQEIKQPEDQSPDTVKQELSLTSDQVLNIAQQAAVTEEKK